MSVPTISLIVPAFNRAKSIGPTIRHIQCQTFEDFELIVVDDGSTDDTKTVVDSFAADNRIRYIHQPNAGPSAARNTGMENAAGEIIVYCDSDDTLYAHCLATIAHAYRDERVTFGICNHARTLKLIDAEGTVLAEKEEERPDVAITLQDFYDWKVKTTSTGLSHRRKFIGKVQWRSGFLIEDLEFIMQLAVLDETGFHAIPEKLLDYEQIYGGDGLCSGASYADYAHAFGAIYDLHKNDPLMKNSAVYLDRVEKYKALQEQVDRGDIPPPQLKYFPEFWKQAV